MTSRKTISRRTLERQAAPGSRHKRPEGDAALPIIYDRPETYGECQKMPRPCPFVSCRYHLFLTVRESGGIHFPFGEETDLHELPATCALDVASEGGKTLEEIAVLMNVTRERVRQLEETALEKIDPMLRDFMTEGRWKQ